MGVHRIDEVLHFTKRSPRKYEAWGTLCPFSYIKDIGNLYTRSPFKIPDGVGGRRLVDEEGAIR